MSDVDEVKSRLNIVEIIQARVPLKKAGRHFKGLCPFHNEKTPSFIVSPERQSWHCFGCGKGGSVIDFVMEYQHVDFLEALEELAEKAGVTLTRSPAETQEGKQKEEIYKVNKLARDYYHYLLTKHPLGEKALLYLKQRGVSEKIITTFQLGYSANSWEGLRQFLSKKRYTEKIMELAGLIIPSPRGGYDRFRGRVMFPLADHRGNIVGFSGRLLDAQVKEAKYINTPETPVYSKSNVLYALDITKANIQKANLAIVVEGEFDVLSPFSEGITNVVAIKGSALTEGHIRLLQRFCDRIALALDADVAGDAASRRGIEIAQNAGLDVRIIVVPSGKDPDEAARENPLALKKAIELATPVYDFLLDSAVKRFDVTTAFGKKKVADELLPSFAVIENPIIQGHYVKKLSTVVGLSEATILDAMKKSKRLAQVVQTVEKSEGIKRSDRPETLEYYVLALLLQGRTRDFMEELCEQIPVSQFAHPGIKELIVRLSAYLQNQQPFFAMDFVKELPQELHAVFDEAYLWDLSGFIGSEDETTKEWQKALKELQKAHIQKTLRMLVTQSAGVDTDEAKVANLQEQIIEVTKKLRQLEKTAHS